jgi:hypothetical protein
LRVHSSAGVFALGISLYSVGNEIIARLICDGGSGCGARCITNYNGSRGSLSRAVIVGKSNTICI